MSTGKEYHDYVMDQLSGLEGVRSIRMMGEYIVYFRDRIACYLGDDRMLYKDTPKAREILAPVIMAKPYPQAHDMLLVENIDDRKFLERLFRETYEELPYPKGRRR